MENNPSPRIAVYARYSSDLQNPSSIDDQVLLCRKLIDEKWPSAPEPVVYSDAALSGDAMKQRPDLARLLAEVTAGILDVVVTEGLDRLSRSMKDIASLYEQLTYHNVSVFTAHEGEVSALHIGLKGTMNALYLTDLKDRVRRSHRARAEKGLAPSGLPYGYRVVRGVLDERGEPVRGLREVHETEGPVVLRIFKEFAAGASAKELAIMLTAEGVTGPGGGAWREGAIRGSSIRGDGILRNEIYRGVLVYNRKRLVTNPMTGRKKYVANDEKDWVRTDVPHMRIVSDGLWGKVKKLLARRSVGLSKRKIIAARKPARIGKKLRNSPLKGLVVCGWCSSHKVMKDGYSYLCSGYKVARACKNARAAKVVDIRDRLFDDLRAGLSNAPSLRGEVRKLIEKDQAMLRASNKELRDIERRINNLLKLIEAGIRIDRSIARIRELEKARVTLAKSVISSIDLPDNVAAIRADIGAGLDRMENGFHDRDQELAIRAGLALVVEKIVLTPLEGEKRGQSIDIHLRPSGWAALWLFMRSWPVSVPDGENPAR